MKTRSLNTIAFITGSVSRSALVLVPFIASDLGLNLSQSGFTRSLNGIMKIALIGFVLVLAKKYNNRKLIYLAMLTYSLGTILMGTAFSFESMIIFQIFTNFGFSTLSPIIRSELAAIAKGPSKGRIISNFSSSGELGGLIATTVIGFLAVWIGWRFSHVILGVLAIVGLVFIIKFEQKHKAEEVEVKTKQGEPLKYFYKNKKLLAALMCTFFDNIASASVFLFIPFLVLAYKYDPIYVPIISGIALFGAVIGKFFFGRLTDTHRPELVFIVCETLMAVVCLTMALTSNIVLLLIAATILGITTKGTNPVRFILVGDAVKTEDTRNAFAIDSVFDNAGSLIAPVFFGIIGDAFGTPAIFIGFTIASLLAVVPASIYYRLNNRIGSPDTSV